LIAADHTGTEKRPEGSTGRRYSQKLIRPGTDPGEADSRERQPHGEG
jgi:hypothetical protein